MKNKSQSSHLPKASASGRLTGLFSLFLLLAPVLCSAQTIYVDISSSSEVENGSATNPYKLLWDGINATDVGDTLFIRNGVYTADPGTPAFLLKDGVITMGEDSAKTIIQGDFGNSQATMTHYTELSNLKCGGVGFWTGDGSAKIVIRNCSTDGVGFASGGGYQYYVENCIMKNGVHNASGSNFIYVRNNKITNGQITDYGDGPAGVECHFYENNEIYFSGNPDDSYNSAIVGFSSSITIKNNTIRATGKSSGIIVSSHAPTNIIGNTIEVDSIENLATDNFCGILTSSGEGVATGNKIRGGKNGYNSSSGANIFSENEISGAYIGFYSSGREEVVNNRITNCIIGMALHGLRGPISENTVTDNDSIGIWVIHNVDLGGGNHNGIGRNIIRGNGYYDMRISSVSSFTDTLFINDNIWDHETIEDILKYDILIDSSVENVFVKIDSIITIPDVPVLSLPENAVAETDTVLNFSWQIVTDAESYKFQLSETLDFYSIFFEQDSIVTPNFTVDSLNFSATYYWRCAAVNLAGESAWSETWSFKTQTPTSVNEMQSSAGILRVYPNPVSGKLYIELSTETTSFTLKIIDIHGRVLRSQKSFSGKSIDVTGLPVGIYYISLQNKKENYNARFVKK